jgi:hypothetical protein
MEERLGRVRGDIFHRQNRTTGWRECLFNNNRMGFFCDFVFTISAAAHNEPKRLEDLSVCALAI